jgi:hypothetical protein
MSNMLPGGDRIERLELDVDLRLRECWPILFSLELEPELTEAIGMLMRAAYASGYHDHATEPLENSLYREHGYSLPTRQRVG